MSIRVMAAVWDSSHHRGAALLLMLAIADFARDDGVAWPTLGTLAHKTRMSDRQIRRLVGECERSGELRIDRSRGRSPHRFRIVLDGERGQVVRVNPDTGVRDRARQPGHLRSPTRTSEVANPDTAMSTQPLEPSETLTPTASPLPPTEIASSNGSHPIGEGGEALVARVHAALQRGRKSWDLPAEATKVWDELGPPGEIAPRIRFLADYVRLHVGEEAISFPRIGTLAKRYGKVALAGLDAALSKGLEAPALYAYAEKVSQRVARDIAARERS